MKREKIRCPICRSEHCAKREIEPSLLEFVCAECTTFVIDREILEEHLYRSIGKGKREIVSAVIKHYFETDGNRIKIVLWHSKKAVNGVTEKTISELKKEGDLLPKNWYKNRGQINFLEVWQRDPKPVEGRS